MLNWEVTQEESGTKLLAFLKQKLGDDYPTRQLKKALEGNLCHINRRTERFGSFSLGTGDQVTLLIDNIAETPKTPLTFEADRVLFEDDHLLVYNKPAGVSSEDPKLLQLIKRNLPFLELAHRLDRDTTGALIFAKTASTLQQILALFKERRIQKSYLTIVDGTPHQTKGTIDNYLGPVHQYQGQTIQGELPPPKGLHAVTEWERLERGNQASLIRCFPKTGRTHQLRVHLNSLGHPILGDHQYGKRFTCAYRPNRYLLHAASLTLSHPQTDRALHVSAPLPADFLTAIKHLFPQSTYEMFNR